MAIISLVDLQRIWKNPEITIAMQVLQKNHVAVP